MKSSWMLAVLALVAAQARAWAAGTGAVSGLIRSHWLEKGYELVVYVEKAEGAAFSPPAERPVVSQRNLVYVPHVLPVVEGWEVEFRTQDKELHNLLARLKEAFRAKASQLFNLAMPPGAPPVVRKFERGGLVTLLCSIHKEMSAYILVLQNPYFARVSKGGAFRLEGVPPGDYALKVWGEKLKPEQLAKSFAARVEEGGVASVQMAP